MAVQPDRSKNISSHPCRHSCCIMWLLWSRMLLVLWLGLGVPEMWCTFLREICNEFVGVPREQACGACKLTITEPKAFSECSNLRGNSSPSMPEYWILKTWQVVLTTVPIMLENFDGCNNNHHPTARARTRMRIHTKSGMSGVTHSAASKRMRWKSKVREKNNSNRKVGDGHTK